MPDGDELLAPREHELDGSAGRAGERGDVSLEVEVAFAPKPPPRSGTMTRTFDSGIPRVSETPARAA